MSKEEKQDVTKYNAKAVYDHTNQINDIFDRLVDIADNITDITKLLSSLHSRIAILEVASHEPQDFIYKYDELIERVNNLEENDHVTNTETE
tara:strand:- start:3441 stop:3716 length:276 start_codon:yes stop_codon:yes gene_type:complete